LERIDLLISQLINYLILINNLSVFGFDWASVLVQIVASAGLGSKGEEGSFLEILKKLVLFFFERGGNFEWFLKF
jgi:hypothetical protein